MLFLPRRSSSFYPCYEQRTLNIKTRREVASTRLGQLMLMALFIIGIIGVSGILPGATIGWTAIGLGIGYMVCKCLGGNIKGRKVDLISSACVASVIIALGALGLSGFLSGINTSWAIGGVVGLTTAIFGLMAYYNRPHSPKGSLLEVQDYTPPRPTDNDGNFFPEVP